MRIKRQWQARRGAYQIGPLACNTASCRVYRGVFVTRTKKIVGDPLASAELHSIASGATMARCEILYNDFDKRCLSIGVVSLRVEFELPIGCLLEVRTAPLTIVH